MQANSPVKNVDPDLSEDQWSNILVAQSSLTGEDIHDGYEAVCRHRVSPAFCLAVFWNESHFGRLGICQKYDTHSPGNTRTSFLGAGRTVSTPQGDYIRYNTWSDGFEDLAARLVGKSDYAGLSTIEQILPVFAPPEDGNDPAAYIQTVVNLINGWLKTMVTQAPPIEWVGSPNYWVGRWGEIIQGIVDHISQGNLNSNIGWFHNPTSEVSSTYEVGLSGKIVQYVSEADTAWANGPIDLSGPDGFDHSVPWLLECAQMGYNPNKRTISIEHEGFTGNPMPETQYQSTLALHKYILARNLAIKSDRTGIIGHYQVNKAQKANCPGTGFPWARLMSDLAAWEQAGGRGQAKEVPPMAIRLNGFVLGGGFLDFYNKHGGLQVFGYPLTEEYTNPITHLTEQVFQGEVLEYDPGETNPDWKVRRKIIGPMYLANRGF